MTHHRVTPEGQALGKSAARLAELGHRRLQATGLADSVSTDFADDMCSSCACRPGSVPNGCLQTQLDFLKAVIDGRRFYCHSPLDGHLCSGWVRARIEHMANPLPDVVQSFVGQWEYSPPDEDDRSDRQ